MKHILFLFFSLSIFAQDTIPATKSVIALDKMNVVYRGIANPISIAVNDAKSYKIYGNGVNKDESGNYFLSPGTSLTSKVYVEITKNDDSIVIEEHEFRILPIGPKYFTINNLRDEGNLVFYLKDLENAKLGVEIENFLFPIDFKVKGFKIKVPKYPTLEIIGNSFTDEVFQLLKKARKKDIIVISDIKSQHVLNGFFKSSPIIFRIIKE